MGMEISSKGMVKIDTSEYRSHPLNAYVPDSPISAISMDPHSRKTQMIIRIAPRIPRMPMMLIFDFTSVMCITCSS